MADGLCHKEQLVIDAAMRYTLVLAQADPEGDSDQ